MTELLAQLPAVPTPILNGNWAAFYALMAILIKDLGKWVSESRKDKAEARAQFEREKIQNKLEEHRQLATDRIANSNEQVVVVLGRIETKLQEAHVLSRVRHEMISNGLTETQVRVGLVNEKLNSTCKGSCEFREPRIKPKPVVEQQPKTEVNVWDKTPNKTFPQ